MSRNDGSIREGAKVRLTDDDKEQNKSNERPLTGVVSFKRREVQIFVGDYNFGGREVMISKGKIYRTYSDRIVLLYKADRVLKEVRNVKDHS